MNYVQFCARLMDYHPLVEQSNRLWGLNHADRIALLVS